MLLYHGGSAKGLVLPKGSYSREVALFLEADMAPIVKEMRFGRDVSDIQVGLLESFISKGWLVSLGKCVRGRINYLSR